MMRKAFGKKHKEIFILAFCMAMINFVAYAIHEIAIYAMDKSIVNYVCYSYGNVTAKGKGYDLEIVGNNVWSIIEVRSRDEIKLQGDCFFDRVN